jgi:hypothetical protein
MMARFFVNLRWTLPLVLSLGLVAVLDATFGVRDVLFWSTVDLALSLGVAALVTGAYEVAARWRLA